MDSFLTQAFSLLTTDAGTLTYHLVLASAILGAFLMAMTFSRRNAAVGRRMLAGLGLLLLFRLGLFVLAGLGLQGLVNTALWLPVADRAVTLFSLVVLIWLWAYPEPGRSGDAATLLLFLLTLTLVSFGGVWWSSHAGESFNGSLVDTGAEITALVLLAMGAALLLARRPQGWGLALGMFALLLAGHLVHLLFPVEGQDFSGAIRFVQMMAYPMLMLLGSRFTTLAAPLPGSTAEQPAGAADPRLLSAFLAISTERDFEQVCEPIASAVSRLMAADLCYLLTTDPAGEQLTFLCGYDRSRQVSLREVRFDARLAPALLAVLRRGHSLRLAPSAAGEELSELAGLLELSSLGGVLCLPVSLPEGLPPLAILLLSPDTQQAWTAEQQVSLGEIARAMAHFLQRNQQFSALRANLESAQQAERAGRQETESLRAEIGQLRQAADQERKRSESLAALAGEREDIQQLIAQLQAENEALRGQVESSTGQGELEGELRMALQEIALLRNALAEADQKLQASFDTQDASGGLEAHSVHPAPGQNEMIELAQELRQPLAAIKGYTDFLLGETMGLLVLQQRKALEKIGAATQRMGRLVDELLDRAVSGGVQASLSLQPVDLTKVVQEAADRLGPEFRQKGISLRVELPESLPSIQGDPQALAQVVSSLLRSAREATPQQGVVWLRARRESREGQEDYLLLQVADTSAGLSAEELARLFSPGLHEPETADRPDLAGVKSVVEAHRGRILVDSDPGHGTIFSVLLPVSEPPAQPGGSVSSNGRGSIGEAGL